MPPSSYLQGMDLTTYGAPNATPIQIVQASLVVDHYLKRPEGLVYGVDGVGQPCYMMGLKPEFTLLAAGGFQPDKNVAVTVSGPAAMIQSGDVLVLDRSNGSLTEACQVSSVQGNVVTLRSVQSSHTIGCPMESGLVLSEHKYLPKDRPLATLSRSPVSRIIGGIGKYAYGRKGDAGNYNVNDFNMLSALTHFGGPPINEIWDATNTNLDPATGKVVWIPAGIMLAYYSEVQIKYVAGFSYSQDAMGNPIGNLPSGVKLACAELIQAIQQAPQLGQVKNYKSGESALEMVASTNLSDDVKAMLAPYKARDFG